MKYRKKPVVIEAMQLPSTNDHISEELKNWLVEAGDDVWFGVNVAYIRTLEGVMAGNPGDWIIKGVKGEFYPCKPDIFELTYEVVE